MQPTVSIDGYSTSRELLHICRFRRFIQKRYQALDTHRSEKSTGIFEKLLFPTESHEQHIKLFTLKILCDKKASLKQKIYGNNTYLVLELGSKGWKKY